MTSLFSQINNSISAKKSLLSIEGEINKSIKLIASSIKKGGKIMLCGNGGSAADAQHLAAEFLIRLRPHVNRKPIPAITLATDTSSLTACGNDYSFEEIFSRSLNALGSKNDVLIAITTSGNSQNILNVLKAAKRKKIKSICFLGNGGGKAKKQGDIRLIVQEKNTARIQECHIFLGHYIFEKVEDIIIGK